MKTAAPITLMGAGSIVVGVSIWAPAWLATNGFLVAFVNHELLNIQAVIMTITIATIATIHIWFNELEEKHKKKVFGDARADINNSAMWLICLFLATLILLITRSFFENQTALSLFNGVAVIILVTNVLVLIDILAVVKALTPR